MRFYILLWIPAFAGMAMSLNACKQAAPPAPKQTTQTSELPRINIKKTSKLLFTYFDSAKQSFESIDVIDKIPQPDRGWVRVVDLNINPQQRRDVELVYVADLRKPKSDGSFAYMVMSRSGFELAAKQRDRAGATDPVAAMNKGQAPASGATQVVLYSTSWCGACRAARQFMTEKKIPFIDYDIEKDPKAAAELMQKAQKAGISASGVPVLDIKGTLVQGFNPDQILSLLGASS